MYRSSDSSCIIGEVLCEPPDGADLRFFGPQPNTRQRCRTMDMGPVYYMVCLFTSQITKVSIVLFRKCVEWLRTELGISLSQVQHPTHHATEPHHCTITRLGLLSVYCRDTHLEGTAGLDFGVEVERRLFQPPQHIKCRLCCVCITAIFHLLQLIL